MTRFLVYFPTDIPSNFDMNILFLCLVKRVSAFILECKDSECYMVVDLSMDYENVLINLVLILCLNYFSYFVKACLAKTYRDLDDTFIFLIFSFTFDTSQFQVVLVCAGDTCNFIIEDYFSLTTTIFFFTKFVWLTLICIDFFSLLLEVFFGIQSFETFSFPNE